MTVNINTTKKKSNDDCLVIQTVLTFIYRCPQRVSKMENFPPPPPMGFGDEHELYILNTNLSP